MPFTQSVTLSHDDDPVEGYAHLMTVSEVRLNAVAPSVFRVDPKLAASGDVKP